MKKPWLLVAWLLVIELLAILLLITATGQTEPSKGIRAGGTESWCRSKRLDTEQSIYGSGRALLIQDSMRGCTKR